MKTPLIFFDGDREEEMGYAPGEETFSPIIEAGKRFKPNEAMLEMFPDSPFWEVIRTAPTDIWFPDKRIENKRLLKWWCGPVGYSFETILRFYNVSAGFFLDKKDALCPCDYYPEKLLTLKDLKQQVDAALERRGAWPCILLPVAIIGDFEIRRRR